MALPRRMNDNKMQNGQGNNTGRSAAHRDAHDNDELDDIKFYEDSLPPTPDNAEIAGIGDDELDQLLGLDDFREDTGPQGGHSASVSELRGNAHDKQISPLEGHTENDGDISSFFENMDLDEEDNFVYTGAPSIDETSSPAHDSSFDTRNSETPYHSDKSIDPPETIFNEDGDSAPTEINDFVFETFNNISEGREDDNDSGDLVFDPIASEHGSGISTNGGYESSDSRDSIGDSDFEFEPFDGSSSLHEEDSDDEDDFVFTPVMPSNDFSIGMSEMDNNGGASLADIDDSGDFVFKHDSDEDDGGFIFDEPFSAGANDTSSDGQGLNDDFRFKSYDDSDSDDNSGDFEFKYDSDDGNDSIIKPPSENFIYDSDSSPHDFSKDDAFDRNDVDEGDSSGPVVSAKPGKSKSGKSSWKDKFEHAKARVLADMHGEDEPDFKSNSIDDEDEDFVGDAPAGGRGGNDGGNKFAGLKPLLTIFKPIVFVYQFLIKICLAVINFVLKVLSFVPFVGKFVAPLQGATRVLGMIAGYMPLVLIVIILLMVNRASVPASSEVVLPDSGSATFSSFKFDSSKQEAVGTITNTGDVIAEVKPDFTMYGMVPSLNPVSWFKPQEVGRCEGKMVNVDIDGVKEVRVKCRPTGGFDVRVSGVLK